MGYNLVVAVIDGPLTVEHGMLMLANTPDSGFFVGQNGWKASCFSLDAGTEMTDAECEAARADEDARQARMDEIEARVLASAKAPGALRDALLSAVSDPDEMDWAERSATSHVCLLGQSLSMGDAIAYGDDEVWGASQSLRILTWDDADMLAEAARKARARCAEGTDPRIGTAERCGVPTDDEIRGFVARHAGKTIVLGKG